MAAAVIPRQINRRLTNYIIRLQIPDITQGKLTGISVQQVDDSDITTWQAIIQAPEDSVYEGGRYYVKIVFPHDAPFKPPKINFITPIHHCNVCVCKPCFQRVSINILDHKWSPSLKLRYILEAIQQLLKEPNVEHPLNCTVTSLYRNDKKAYATNVRQHVIEHAINDYQRYSLIPYHTLNTETLPNLLELSRTTIRMVLRNQGYLNFGELIEKLPLPERIKEFLATRNDYPSSPKVDEILYTVEPRLRSVHASKPQTN